MLDFLTIFLWEVVGTPVELALDGTKYQADVLYDGDGFAIEVELHDMDEGKTPIIQSRRWPGGDKYGSDVIGSLLCSPSREQESARMDSVPADDP